MSCTGDATDIGLFATGLWQSLGQPSDISVFYVSGYVALPSTLGALNAYIGTCYSGVGGAYVCPNMDDGSFAIVGQMFTQSYYLNLMRAQAGAGGAQKVLYELREADSQIKWVSAAEFAKVYLQASKDAQVQLKYLVKAYNDNSQGGNLIKDVEYPSIGLPYNGGNYTFGGYIRE